MTSQYAVIGNPIAHSQSPRIHQLFAQQTGQDLSYERVLSPLPDFAKTVKRLRDNGYQGSNVTVPFKHEAFQLASHHTQRAVDAGAVNTLTFINGEIRGDNTDGIGLVRDLRVNHAVAIQGKRILLLGAGGASHGILPSLLAERPAQLVISNRTVSKAEALVHHMRLLAHTPTVLSSVPLSALSPYRFDLIINATSAGLGDDALLLPDEIFAECQLAYDLLYGVHTGFMQQAEEQRVMTVDGLGMLVEQAAEAFFVWRGIRPATQAVIALLEKPL